MIRINNYKKNESFIIFYIKIFVQAKVCIRFAPAIAENAFCFTIGMLCLGWPMV
jgi:hypothetical protein